MQWAIQIRLDNVDVTDDIIGAVTVEEIESGSAIANARYQPDTPGDYTGLKFEVFLDVGSGLQRIHLGTVIESQLNMMTGIVGLQSSTRLQEYFRQLTEPQILAALPGSVYSEAAFGQTEDRWKFAQDALSTIPSEVHIDRAGNLEIASWTAKTTPDHTFTGDDVRLASNSYLERSADDRVNREIIEYGYGYSRWKSRQHEYSYDLSYNNPAGHITWCDLYNAGGQDRFNLPLVDTIRQAVTGSGWSLDTEQYTGHPQTADCQGNLYDLDTEPSIEQQRVANAYLKLFKNYTQPIGEDYMLTVESSASIARYTVVTRTRSAGRDIQSDDDTHTDESGYQSLWTADAIGDRYQDQDDEPTRQNDIQSLIQAAHVRIWERHRNELTIFIDPSASYSLADTVQINSVPLSSGHTLTAKGKVSRLVYTLDPATPELQMTLAITRGAAGTGDALTPPSRPSTEPTHTAPPTNTILNNHIGFRLDSQNYSNGGDQWTGWLTNSGGIFIPPDVPTEDQTYPEEFRVESIGIEDDAAQEFAATSSTTYNVSIPDDLYSLV